MIDNEFEFSLSQYLDNNLSTAETAALEARLQSDPAARELLEEYRRIDSLLKAPSPMPAIAWDKLANHLSDATADDAEQFEFAISQYADGHLSPDQLADFEARLTENPVAQATLSHHRQLNSVLKSSAHLPEMHWDRLAAHLSNAIADVAEPPSIKLFPNRWVRGFGSLAMAACVLIASVLGIRSYLSHPKPTENQVVISPKSTGSVNVAINTQATPILVEIGGPDPEPATGIAVADISIGAGPQAAINDSPAFAEGIITRSPRSLIASNAATVQDSAQMPY